MISTETEEFITQNLLKELVEYDPIIGIMTYKITTSNKNKKGGTVGYVNDGGYTEVMIFGNKYLVHRLIWKYVYNKFPDNFIDHINGIRTDNRLDNLREASTQQNSWNSSTRKDSTTGYKGVSIDKRCGKYRAYININGKQKSLGYYTTAYEAHLVREKYAAELHGEFYNENTIHG